MVTQGSASLDEDTDELKDLGTGWRQRSNAKRDKMKMPREGMVGGNPFTGKHSNLMGVPQTRRHYDVIDTNFQEYKWQREKMRKKARKENTPMPQFSDDSSDPDIYCMPGQNVDRCKAHPFLSTQCRSSLPFSYKLKSIMTVESLFSAHGFPNVNIGTPRGRLSPSKSQSLLGEAIHLGSLGIVLYSTFLDESCPWWQAGEVPISAEQHGVPQEVLTSNVAFEGDDESFGTHAFFAISLIDF